ncbi:substrate-binding domain-containing protein [Galbitalea soli]|uniref:Substrate-binding domain-containing protein n=1 Tax=Galbitalea soli TaxID=1268042 RepID=A0A7C9TT65_9MICO|nr:substrate-binding domain-containing protein [Galbitalea soli]
MRPRPTLAAVARLAGVSVSTASLAFSGAGPVSDATKARVAAAADELGYAGPDPRAQSLRRGRSGIIGVVIEERLSDAFRDPMNIALLDGIADVTGAAGSGLLLLTETGDDRAGISSAPMDAIILIGCSTSLEEAVAIVRQRGLPIVAVEARELEGVLPIGLDNRAASATGARHLRSLGHSDIGVVTLPLERSHVPRPLPADWERVATAHTSAERLRGVLDVYPEARGFAASASTIEAGREAGLALLAGDRATVPTAIVAQSDLLAIGVIRAADEVGMIVPGDLSVVGFDGIRGEVLGGIDLTTLVQPAVEKGRAAGRAALQLLDGGPAEPADFTSVFHPGGTTAPPRTR